MSGIKINKRRSKKNLTEKERDLQKKSKIKGFDAKKFSGKLKGVFGDPLEYQRKLRDEWN